MLLEHQQVLQHQLLHRLRHRHRPVPAVLPVPVLVHPVQQHHNMLTQLYFEKNGPTAVSENNPLPVNITSGTSEFSENVNSNNALNPVRLVNGQSDKAIKVTYLTMSVQTATRVTLQDENGTALFGPIYIAANTPFSSAVNIPVGTGLDLNFVTSTQTNVTVFVSGSVI